MVIFNVSTKYHSTCLFFHFRDVKLGKQSFVLSSVRDAGKLQSVEVQFRGPGFFLKKVVVYSKVENKR